jgi:hypothetical protein
VKGRCRSRLFYTWAFRLGVYCPFRRHQIVQNPSGSLLDRGERVDECLLVAVVEGDVIGGSVVGFKADAPAHYKCDRLRLGLTTMGARIMMPFSPFFTERPN